ncbi:ABC transporter permease [Planctomycetota bacterium]
MGFWEAIKLGLENILLHKLRALLTMLGMIFGVAAVISMLSIGSGAREEALEQIRVLGINNIWIRSLKTTEVKEQEEQSQVTSSDNSDSGPQDWGLTIKDMNHIKTVVPNLARVVSLKEVREEIRTTRKRVQLQVIGTEPLYQEIMGLKLDNGRFIASIDLEEAKKVCALGAEAKKILFGPYRRALGETLRIGQDYFKVVGILASKPSGKGTRNINLAVYIPFSPELKKTRISWSFEERKTVVESEAEIDEICFQVADTELIQETTQIINNALAQSHPQGDYTITVPQELLEQSRRTQWIFNVVMGSIAGISLLVGGIGIMNIMLATVTERTREIGIRRALGAQRRDIIKQFLVETLVLSFIGGVIGIGLGIGGAKGIPLLAGGEYKTIISIYPVLAAFSISLTIGIIFGTYPAYKAANVSPMEALRHE